MLSHITKRIQVLAFVGFGAALTGCTAVPDVTESAASAQGTLVTSDGATTSVKLTNASGAPSFDSADASYVSASIDIPTSDGGTARVDLSALVPTGTSKDADLASLGAKVCVCREDPSEPSACLDTPVCGEARGTFTGTYDDTDTKNGNVLHQFDGTFILADPAGYTGTIHFVHHEDWAYNSGTSGNGNSFWNTNWNG